jgi:uncharacterized protein (TIGR02594 family)
LVETWEPIMPMKTASQLNEALIAEAKKWVGVKETGPNTGPEIKKFQEVIGGAEPVAWCASFVQYCIAQIEKSEKIKSQIMKSEHVMTIWDKTPKMQRLDKPEPGCLVIWQKFKDGKPTLWGHIGIVLEVPKPNVLVTIEGNTSSDDGVNRDGDGVYRKIRSYPSLTKSMQIRGFLRVWNA